MKLSSKKVVVVGGAGFIGSHLVDTLAENHDVVVLDNLSTGKIGNLDQALATGRVTLRSWDICRERGLQELLEGSELVFHLATQCLRLSLANPDLVHQVNVTGTLNLLKASREVGIKKFIYVSSSEVYGTAQTAPMSEDHPFDPTTIYGASKLAGEFYARVFYKMYGLATVIIRPFNTYGPRSHFEGYSGEVIPKFVLRVLGGKPPVIFGTGRQTRDFTYISDVVRGMMLAANRLPLGQAVNIACGREISIQEIADSVLAVAGTNSLKPVYAPARPADVMRHYADIRRAKTELGFIPEVPIQEGLKHYVAWFKQEFGEKIDQCLAAEVERNW